MNPTPLRAPMPLVLALMAALCASSACPKPSAAAAPEQHLLTSEEAHELEVVLREQVAPAAVDDPAQHALAEQQVRAQIADLPEARVFVRASKNPHALPAARFKNTADALKYLDSLYKAGAPLVRANDIDDERETLAAEKAVGPHAASVLVEMPKDPAARARLVALCTVEAKRLGEPEGCSDDGSDYMVIGFTAE